MSLKEFIDENITFIKRPKKNEDWCVKLNCVSMDGKKFIKFAGCSEDYSIKVQRLVFICGLQCIEVPRRNNDFFKYEHHTNILIECNNMNNVHKILYISDICIDAKELNDIKWVYDKDKVKEYFK